MILPIFKGDYQKALRLPGNGDTFRYAEALHRQHAFVIGCNGDERALLRRHMSFIEQLLKRFPGIPACGAEIVPDVYKRQPLSSDVLLIVKQNAFISEKSEKNPPIFHKIS